MKVEGAIDMIETEVHGKRRKGMKCNKNKNIQITFNIREKLYFQFKTLCQAERRMPAAVIKELINNYVEEREKENE